MTTILNAMLAAAAEQPSMLPTILMFVALGAVMYFFMIRPQQKKQKEINNFRNSLTVGQTVVTIGGLHGTIKTMDDTTVTSVLKRLPSTPRAPHPRKHNIA